MGSNNLQVKRFDVLVCTTIVETGLDISNANTLIVERSDMLGLSQPACAGRSAAAAERLRLLPLPARDQHDRLPRPRTIASNTTWAPAWRWR